MSLYLTEKTLRIRYMGIDRLFRKWKQIDAYGRSIDSHSIVPRFPRMKSIESLF